MSLKQSAYKLFSFLRRDGVIPGTAVISLITTSNTAQYFFENPLSSTAEGLLFGGIGGYFIEALTPIPARAFVSGYILFATAVSIVGRSCGFIRPPREYRSYPISPPIEYPIYPIGILRE